jgi:hypothetical protein
MFLAPGPLVARARSLAGGLAVEYGRLTATVICQSQWQRQIRCRRKFHDFNHEVETLAVEKRTGGYPAGQIRLCEFWGVRGFQVALAVASSPATCGMYSIESH